MSIQVRSCDDSACSGESFRGPDGTTYTDYEGRGDLGNGRPLYTITNTSTNQYFQYRAIFQSHTTDEMELLGVGINGSP